MPARHIFLRYQVGQPLCASRVWFSLLDTFKSQLHGRKSHRKQSARDHPVALQQHHTGLISTIEEDTDPADLLPERIELERLPESTHSESLPQGDVDVLENQRGGRAGWREFFQKSCQVIMEG